MGKYMPTPHLIVDTDTGRSPAFVKNPLAGRADGPLSRVWVIELDRGQGHHQLLFSSNDERSARKAWDRAILVERPERLYLLNDLREVDYGNDS